MDKLRGLIIILHSLGRVRETCTKEKQKYREALTQKVCQNYQAPSQAFLV